jgi:hypothetical protein
VPLSARDHQGDHDCRYFSPVVVVRVIRVLRYLLPVACCLLVSLGIRLSVANEVIEGAVCYLLGGWLFRLWLRRP